MSSAVDRVKATVTMMDIVQRYGLHVNRDGFACCPFHREKTASFKIYPGSRGWHCFGCDASGDVIDFVQQSFGLSFHDALVKLDNDFHLGLGIGQKSTTTKYKTHDREQEQREIRARLREENIQRARQRYHDAVLRYTVLELIANRYAPKRPADLSDETVAALDFDSWWAAALHLIPAAEYDLEQAEIALYEAEKRSHQ